MLDVTKKFRLPVIYYHTSSLFLNMNSASPTPHSGLPCLHHCLFILRAWFSIWFHQEKRDQLLRINHLLSLNLKIICHHDLPYLSSYIIHSFFNWLIYPFIWHSLRFLCARHCARCCKWMSEFDSIPAARKGKKPPFPPQSDCFAYAVSGIPSHFLGDHALSTASLACVSANNSSHSASSFLSGFKGLRFLLY